VELVLSLDTASGFVCHILLASFYVYLLMQIALVDHIERVYKRGIQVF